LAVPKVIDSPLESLDLPPSFSDHRIGQETALEAGKLEELLDVVGMERPGKFINVKESTYSCFEQDFQSIVAKCDRHRIMSRLMEGPRFFQAGFPGGFELGGGRRDRGS
jgi:hypothetical protein